MATYYQLLLAGLILAVQIILGTVDIAVQAQNANFSFPYFSTPDGFLMVDDVQHDAVSSSFLMNSKGAASSNVTCGRLLYNETVRMKDSKSGAVASFNTAFTFQITGPVGYYHGDGLAFTFTRNSYLLDETTGAFFCLRNEFRNGNASNRVFAVEFDTHLNGDWNDPSDSHIGVDVNSINSTWYYNLCEGSIWKSNCTYLSNGGYFTAWIDNDSASQKLQVFFTGGSLYNDISKPPKPMIEALNLPLAELVDDNMYVGFSSSIGAWVEVHQIQSWKFASSDMPPSPASVPTNPNSSRRRKVGIIAGVSAGAVAALLVVGLFIARCRRRTLYIKPHDKFNLVDQNLVPRLFTYKELSKATKNFNESELLGRGGFGTVYKGTLPLGTLLAVKQMKHGSKHGEESFQAEAASLSQIRHRNLVQLRGWCSEEEQLFLVYDYMCKGSLDEWLFRSSKRNEMEAFPLNLRHSVLRGVAAALSYLHEECAQCVLHRDIKSSNVLLDGDLNAYLRDFGLARLVDHRKMGKTTMMAGTFGYMAPEMPHTGKATKESDVFSFGVLMLEVICGVRPLDMTAIEQGDIGVLVDKAWRAHEAGNILQVADSRLGKFPFSDANAASDGDFESQEVSCIPIHALDGAMDDKKMVTNLLHLGLLCCNPNPEDRPSMRLVSQLLQSSESMGLLMPCLPSCKPQAYYNMPGFSQLLARVPLSDSISSSVRNADYIAGQESSQSTAPSPGVWNGEPAKF